MTWQANAADPLPVQTLRVGPQAGGEGVTHENQAGFPALEEGFLDIGICACTLSTDHSCTFMISRPVFQNMHH